MSIPSARLVLALALLLFLPLLWGAWQVENRTDDMRQWLPSGCDQLQQYDQFVENFGAEDSILVSWEGCTLSDPRLEQFAAGVRRRVAQAPPASSLIRHVLTGPELVARLTSDPMHLSHGAAIRRLQGTFVGQDGDASAALVAFAGLASTPAEALIEQIYEVAQQECGLAPSALRLAGGPYEAMCIDQVSKRDLEWLLLPSCAVGFFVALFSLRSVRLALLILGIAAYCALGSVALVYFGGDKLNAVMVVLPTLVFVLVVSGGVHLANYYREALPAKSEAARQAFAVGWLPCTLATVSTAIGLFSLQASQIQPVEAFGFYAAVSLLLALGVLLALFVAALVVFPAAPSEAPADSAAESPTGKCVADWLVAHHRSVSLVSLLLLGVLGAGLAWTSTSVKIERMLRPDSQLVENYRWLEETIGPLASLEVVVAFAPEAEEDLLARTQLIAEIQRGLAPIDPIGATLSAASLVPSVSNLGGLRATARRSLVRTALAESTAQLEDEGFLARTETGQHWRITARLPALAEFDYPAVIARAQQKIRDVLAADPFFSSDQVAITFTGAYPLIDSAQQQLLDDLIHSFLWAFVLICPLMMLILRSFWAGLIAMLPNVLPVALVFGGMGWLSMPVDIGTVLTCSVALGIALDDTLHFLVWFRRGVVAGQDRKQAIIGAHRQCRAAMLQTTLICGLALAVFGVSGFVPTSQFAVLMCWLLLMALLGDLVFLPALLAGPAGRYFVPAEIPAPLAELPVLEGATP